MIGVIYNRFDPINLEDRYIIMSIVREKVFSKIYIIPKAATDWDNEMADVEDRTKMLELEFSEVPEITVANIDDSGHLFGVLQKLGMTNNPWELYVISTTDKLEKLPLKYMGEKIIQDYRFYVVSKDGSDRDPGFLEVLMKMPEMSKQYQERRLFGVPRVDHKELWRILGDSENPLPLISREVWNYLKENDIQYCVGD